MSMIIDQHFHPYIDSTVILPDNNYISYYIKADQKQNLQILKCLLINYNVQYNSIYTKT